MGESGLVLEKELLSVSCQLQSHIFSCHFQLSSCPRGRENYSLFYILSSGIGILSNFCACILWLTDINFSSALAVLYYFAPPDGLSGRVLTWFKVKKNIFFAPLISLVENHSFSTGPFLLLYKLMLGKFILSFHGMSGIL